MKKSRIFPLLVGAALSGSLVACTLGSGSGNKTSVDNSKKPLNIYNASDNFLSSTYQPLLQNYDDKLMNFHSSKDAMECRLQNIAQSIWENEYEKKKSVRYSVCHYDGSLFDDSNYIDIYGVIALQSI